MSWSAATAPSGDGASAPASTGAAGAALSIAEAQVAQRLGIPSTRAALTTATDRLIALFRVLDRLHQKYGGPDDPVSS